MCHVSQVTLAGVWTSQSLGAEEAVGGGDDAWVIGGAAGQLPRIPGTMT
jgi:hypothetical protein